MINLNLSSAPDCKDCECSGGALGFFFTAYWVTCNNDCYNPTAGAVLYDSYFFGWHLESGYYSSSDITAVCARWAMY